MNYTRIIASRSRHLVVVLIILFSASFFGRAQTPTAPAASDDCMCWFDSKTGEQVPTVPAGGAERDLSNPNSAYNPILKRNYFRNPDGCWFDSKTGEQVPTVPAGGAERDLSNPNSAYNPILKRNYFRKPCPPPTTTPPPPTTPKTNDVVKTASADSGVVPAQDKSHYNLFKMTPRELRRPYETDHGADSARTIDAGAFAADVSFGYDYTMRSSDMVDRTDTSWDYGKMWLKAGILNNLDLEVGISPWQTHTETFKDSTGHDSDTVSGFGDLMTRVKLNLWGNDGGPSALSVAGTIKWPTASDELKPRDHYEGGLSVQYEYQFPCGFELRVNSGFMLRGFDDGCWESCFDNRLALYHPIVGNLSVLAAFNSTVSTVRHSDWEGEFQTGFIYKVTPNFQIFLGSGFGVNGNASDFSPSFALDFRY